MHQSVVQKAVYDVDIKFGLKVLGHQGMGLVRWPLWGWMEFAIWSRALWGNHGLRQRVVQNVVYDVDIEHDFGVLGHQGMGLARSPLWGWMEFAIWSTAWGAPGLVRQSVVQNAIYGMDIILLFWGPWEPRDGSREVGPLGMDGVCHLEQGPRAPEDLRVGLG